MPKQAFVSPEGDASFGVFGDFSGAGLFPAESRDALLKCCLLLGPGQSRLNKQAGSSGRSSL